MTDKNIDLAYKGDWCEQTAEFAKYIGDRETMERNYRRAIEAYETGGFTDQALRVARIIDDREKISELEGKL
jgi:hypothetical protein